MREVMKSGFTLIELLVVMAIIAVLTTISVVNFRNIQIKARDGQRKSDLGQLQRALELYLNDYGSYPLASDGQVNSFSWKTPDTAGAEFTDGKTVYMKELVGDPKADPNYCYISAGASYQIYAKLENENDPEKSGPYTCAGVGTYNFGVTSSNTKPGESF